MISHLHPTTTAKTAETTTEVERLRRELTQATMEVERARDIVALAEEYVAQVDTSDEWEMPRAWAERFRLALVPFVPLSGEMDDDETTQPYPLKEATR